jgi:hypothetical protein
MTDRNVRALLESEWLRISSEAERAKNSQGAVSDLMDLFRGLPDVDRRIAEEVLMDWAQSTDPKKRYDGLLLIDELSVTSAIPMLKQLANRLKGERDPSSPFDLAKVNRILERLSS